MLDLLGQPLSPYDPNDYYSGFYEAYEFGKKDRDLLTRCVSTSLAVLSICISSFTIPALLYSGRTNTVYRRVIMEHILMSTAVSVLFPITGITILPNYRSILMDKWLDAPILALITAAIIIYGYLAVAVFCGFTFLLNFVISTDIRINLPLLRNYETSKLLRSGAILYGVSTSFLAAVIFYESVNYNTFGVIGTTIAFDPRLVKVFAEKNIHTLVVTHGLTFFVYFLGAVSIIFLFGSILIIYYNYIRINQHKGKMSKLVRRQQKLIIRIEILYYLMIILCYTPPAVTILVSVFLKSLPDAWKRSPCFLLICVPLQLLPTFDCLLHVSAIRAYRETASRLFRKAFCSRKSSIVKPEPPISIQLSNVHVVLH